MGTRLAPRPILPTPRPHHQPFTLPPHLSGHCVLSLLSTQSDKWLDHSGNDNDATNYGATITSKGKYGPAWSFDGTDDYLQVAHSSSLDITGTEIGLEVIISWSGNTGTSWYRIIEKQNKAYALRVQGTNNLVDFTVNGLGTLCTSNTSLDLNTRYHLFGIFDSSLPSASRSRLFINGLLDKSASISDTNIESQSNALIISSQFYPFNGLIDLVRIYNIAPSSSDIFALYQSTL